MKFKFEEGGSKKAAAVVKKQFAKSLRNQRESARQNTSCRTLAAVAVKKGK